MNPVRPLNTKPNNVRTGKTKLSRTPHISPVILERRPNFKKSETPAESLAALKEELSIKRNLLEIHNKQIQKMENQPKIKMSIFEMRDLESINSEIRQINEDIKQILPLIRKFELLQNKSYLAIKVNPATEYQGSPLGTPRPPSGPRNTGRRGRAVVPVGGRRTRKHRKSRSRK